MKVLHIPSWYPSRYTQTGYYFKELNKLYILNNIESRFLFIQHVSSIGRNKINLYGYNKLVYFYLKYFKLKILGYFNYLEYTDSELDTVAYYSPLFDLITNQYYYYNELFLYYDFFYKLYERKYGKPDFIHAHSIQWAGVVVRMLAKKYGLKYVITEHNFFSLHRFDKKIWPTIKSVFVEAYSVGCVSYAKVQQIASYDISLRDKHVVLYNYVDELRLRLCDIYVPGNKLKIISVTSASHFKDNITALKSILDLYKSGCDFHFTIVGLGMWGSEQISTDIIKFIFENGLSNNITILHKLDNNQLLQLYEENHVFLLTSLSEGMPVSVLESMNSGLYVVATPHGGTEEIIKCDNRLGALVPFYNYSQISNILLGIYNGKILHDPLTIRSNVMKFSSRDSFMKRSSKLYHLHEY
jgi:glycosyltransferase involved in cell wall biosynthesis